MYFRFTFLRTNTFCEKFFTSHFIHLGKKHIPKTQAASQLELGINQPETRQDVIGQLPEAPFCDTTDPFRGSRNNQSAEVRNNRLIPTLKLLPTMTSWKDPMNMSEKEKHVVFFNDVTLSLQGIPFLVGTFFPTQTQTHHP